MMKKSFSMKKDKNKNKNKKKNRLHLLTQKDMNVMLLKKFCAISFMARKLCIWLNGWATKTPQLSQRRSSVLKKGVRSSL